MGFILDAHGGPWFSFSLNCESLGPQTNGITQLGCLIVAFLSLPPETRSGTQAAQAPSLGLDAAYLVSTGATVTLRLPTPN